MSLLNASAVDLEVKANGTSSESKPRDETGEQRKLNLPQIPTKKTIKSTIQAGGTAIQSAGVVTQVAGTAIKAAGNGISAAGAAISATGVGSVVGVPLVAVGRAVSVGGIATKTTGKVMSRTGKAMRKAGNKINRPPLRARNSPEKKDAFERITQIMQKRAEKKLSSMLYRAAGRGFKIGSSSAIFFTCLSVWLTVQLPIAIVGLISFGVAGAVDMTLASEGGIAAWFAKKVIQSIDLIASVFGTGLADSATALFFLSQIIILSIFLITALILFLFFTLKGMHPLSGSGAGFKMGAFLLCFIGYSMPLLNMFPFVILWVFAVYAFSLKQQ